jgi:hypothetical protein
MVLRKRAGVRPYGVLAERSDDSALLSSVFAHTLIESSVALHFPPHSTSSVCSRLSQLENTWLLGPDSPCQHPLITNPEPRLSLISQRHHRIDLGGSASRQVTRQ